VAGTLRRVVILRDLTSFYRRIERRTKITRDSRLHNAKLHVKLSKPHPLSAFISARVQARLLVEARKSVIHYTIWRLMLRFGLPLQPPGVLFIAPATYDSTDFVISDSD
jgi:hypothetical protein